MNNVQYLTNYWSYDMVGLVLLMVTTGASLMYRKMRKHNDNSVLVGAELSGVCNKPKQDPSSPLSNVSIFS